MQGAPDARGILGPSHADAPVLVRLSLNEPETSLHVDVLPALAELIAAASEHSQVLVTTHARELSNALAAATCTAPFELELRGGQTRIVGRGRYE